MPHLEDGTPGRRDPQPARRAEPDEPRARSSRRTSAGSPAAAGTTTAPRPTSTARQNGGRVNVATPVFDGATVEDVDEALVRWQEEHGKDRGINFDIDKSRACRPTLRRARSQLYNGRTGEPYEETGHRRLHVHPEAAAPRGRQDPRAQHGPLLARHPAAAGRQGAVRRPALRRDGGVGARGLRRGVHPPGDAHDQVRRHGRPREGLRGDRQGREHRRALHPGVVQGAAEGDAVARARRGRALRGGRRRRDARRGRRPAARRRGARHRPLRRARHRRRGRRRVRGERSRRRARRRPDRTRATPSDAGRRGRRASDEATATEHRPTEEHRSTL